MNQETGRANLFLIELILNLLIFGLCSAICVNLLMQARRINIESGEMTDSLYIAQSAAEQLRAGETPPEEWPGGYTVTLSEPTAPSDGVRMVCVEVSKDGALCFTLEEVAVP